MKIFREVRGETVCYLQNYDADALSKISDVPGSVILEIHRYAGNIYSHDGYRFAYRFEYPESVEYLKDQDWILDLDQFRYMEPYVLARKALQEENECKERVAEYNTKSRAYREQNYAEVGEYITRKRNAVLSLEVLAEYIEGKRNFALPEEIFPEDFWVSKPEPPGLLRRIVNHFRK